MEFASEVGVGEGMVVNCTSNFSHVPDAVFPQGSTLQQQEPN